MESSERPTLAKSVRDGAERMRLGEALVVAWRVAPDLFGGIVVNDALRAQELGQALRNGNRSWLGHFKGAPEAEFRVAPTRFGEFPIGTLVAAREVSFDQYGSL